MKKLLRSEIVQFEQIANELSNKKYPTEEEKIIVATINEHKKNNWAGITIENEAEYLKCMSQLEKIQNLVNKEEV